MNDLFLIFAGLVAGTIDSIAGGGGLITLPSLSTILEPGPHAIGTNKIVGTAGALMAFLVYLRKQPLHIKKGLSFIVAVGVGSVLGSLCSPLVPRIYFRYFLIAACPLILFVLWNKQGFMKEARDQARATWGALVTTGVAVGFYDGFFGPGGGTFMLIGLMAGARMSLFEALLLSKLANTLSAAVSLTSYGIQGFVHTRYGLIMAIGMTAGSFMGARLASKKAEQVVRPVLVFVVLLLMAVQIRDVFGTP
jgi:uncharacterized membrane protein YfcA